MIREQKVQPQESSQQASTDDSIMTNVEDELIYFRKKVGISEQEIDQIVKGLLVAENIEKSNIATQTELAKPAEFHFKDLFTNQQEPSTFQTYISSPAARTDN